MSLSNEHAPDIKSVTQRLQEAVDETWKTRGRSRYKSGVNVLLLHWKDDDLGVTEEIELLRVIFSESYHYSVESWEIPGEKPTRELQRRIAEFIDSFDKPDALLIVYYAGHAIQNEQRDDSPIWVS